MNNIIVGMGEALWDVLPEGKKIGGAPANFAYHVSQFGFDSRVVSAVGNDELGDEIMKVFKEKQLKNQIERVDYPTGTVQVTLDDEGVPCYEIKEGVAWDNIPFTDELKRLALNTRAVCFGSLAQRNEVSRATINRFLDTMPDIDGQLKIFDINLRQDFYTKEVLRESFKRTPLTEFRAQNRGGVGSKGTETRDADFVEHIYPATMHNTMMFFTQKGKCYWLKVYEIPEGTKNSKGRAIQNLLNIDSDDSVTAYLRVKSLDDTEYINSHYVLFCTKKGVIKKTLLEQYSRPRQNGVNAITIREDDSVIEVRMTNGNNEIIIANRNGRAIRFHEAAVRVMGRTATGVRGITLDNDGQDEVIGMICIKDLETESVMVVSEQGYGKRSEIEDYRKTNRGGKGVKTMNITEKTGKLVTIKSVTDENDLMIINKSGITIRLKVADVRIMGRATQGVRLINLEKRNDQIGSVCKVMTESLEDEVPAEEAEGTIVSDLTTDQDVDNADTATDVNENNNEIEE